MGGIKKSPTAIPINTKQATTRGEVRMSSSM